MDRLIDIERYVEAWTPEQIMIWQEQLERLGVIRSGRLHQSLQGAVSRAEMGVWTIRLKFFLYGIYQAMGVGNGYTHGNGGDLMILNKDYREAHGMNKPRPAGPVPGYGKYQTSGHPRERRDWYERKLYMSRMAMIEDLARILKEMTTAVICEELK